MGHKDLPWPTLQQVADADGTKPSADVERAIVVAVEEALRSKGTYDPYWIHAEVHQAYPDVTIGQVARVLIDRELTP